MGKASKYLHYVRVISQSPDKSALFNDLLKEIRLRGTITGIQSFLHQRANYFFPGYDVTSGEDPVLLTGKKHKHLMISLPLATVPKVSVIIPCTTSVEQVYYCIRSFAQYSDFTNYEVIVVDDGSVKDVSRLTAHIQNLSIVRNDKTVGYIKSLKQAVKQARGEMFLFVSPGVRPQRGWIQEMLLVFDKFEQVGIVGSKHLNADRTLKEAGGIVCQDGSVWGYGAGEVPEAPAYNFVRDVDHVSASTMMISKAAWEKSGGFDERYNTAFCEDTDLCFEVRKCGLRVMYQPMAVLTHYDGVRTLRNLDEPAKKQMVADRQLFREKWEIELKSRPKKGIRSVPGNLQGASKRSVLIIDQEIPDGNANSPTKHVHDLVELLLELKCRVTFLCTYTHHSAHLVQQLQQRGIEVLMGDHQEYVKECLPYYDAVVMCRIAACIPYIVLLRNNNFKGAIINFGRELSHLKVDREIVVKRDLIFDLQSKLLKAQEDFVYTHADHSLMVNWEEIEYLKTYVSKQLHYIPPFHFDVTAAVNTFDKRDGLLFVGEGNHIADQDAMKWLLKIYEPIHNKGIRLTMAVSNAPAFLFDQKKKYNLLTIVSDTAPDTVEKLYGQVKALVVPLRIGAGMKGRIVEAMAHGVPVLGTFLAFEGMPRSENFVQPVHNTEMDMQNGMADVCNNAATWQFLSANGIEYTQKHFDSACLKRTLVQILYPA